MAAVTADFIMHDPVNGNAAFDTGRATDAYNFWNGLGTPLRAPYDCVPGIELLQKQMVTVLSQLQARGSLLTGIINGVTTVPTSYGQSIIDAMGITLNNTPQAIQQAVIHSMLTPHRQIALPTCNMDSIIAKESLEHPENLAEIYHGILTSNHPGAVEFPEHRGTYLPLQMIIAATPASPVTRIAVRPITPRNWDNVNYFLGPACRANWGTYEITEYLTAGNCDGFDYPVHDMNDVFFAMFMQEVYRGATASTAFIDSRNFYYGTPGNDGLNPGNALNAATHTRRHGVGPPKFTSGEINTFKGTVAGRGNVATIFSQPASVVVAGANYSPIGATGVYLNHLRGHIENMYLDKITALDPATMTNLSTLRPPKILPGTLAAGEFRVIGDRNWLEKGEPVYLGVVRTGANEFQVVEVIKDTAGGGWAVRAAVNGAGWVAVYDK
jgi:hypothetical protein